MGDSDTREGDADSSDRVITEYVECASEDPRGRRDSLYGDRVTTEPTVRRVRIATTIRYPGETRSMVLRWLPGRGRDDVALLVDGPNVFREEFDVDLADLRSAGESLGRLTVARVYFNVRAPSGLLQAAEAHGFAVRVTSGDVDVALAVDGTELVSTGAVDTLAIASRDMDFKPVLETANARGVRTVAIAPGDHGRSAGLRNAAEESIVLD